MLEEDVKELIQYIKKQEKMAKENKTINDVEFWKKIHLWTLELIEIKVKGIEEDIREDKKLKIPVSLVRFPFEAPRKRLKYQPFFILLYKLGQGIFSPLLCYLRK